MPIASSRRTRLVALAAALLLALGLASAAEPARAETVTRSISGTVSLPQGAPLDYYVFVFVRATGLDGQPGGFVAVSPTDGTYTLDGLEPGRYRISFPLYLTTETQSLTIPPLVRTSYWPGAVTQGTSTPVDLTTADATSIDQTMEWTGTLSGDVTIISESVAKPSPGLVTVWLAGARGTHFTATPGAYGYTFTNLPPDTYDVSFGIAEDEQGSLLPDVAPEWFDDAYSYLDATPVTVAPRAAVTGIDAVLEKGVWSATPRPTIAAPTVKPGATLTARSGTWAPSALLAYRWNRDGVAIDGANAATYVLATADLGAAVTVTVTGAREGFDTVARTSAAVAVPAGFASAPTPTISGRAKAGETLTAVPGTWSPRAALTFRWFRDGIRIAGATTRHYTVTKDDRGHTLTAKVTAQRSGDLKTSRTSAGKAVPKVFSAAPTPTIAGTPAVGSTLRARTGTWTPTPTSLAYRWYRDGVAISGATARTYSPVAKDRGARITVKVTARKPGFLATSRTSAAVRAR
ncbi:carboxypeptidase-like regulatory domain-containing protein [Demequina rhizosphaerae]|uniref:carboxypeptidase-like regulatory domain-containing protein n=1 Tax=Demequina rhizosphaerae TaxID=1638985 RepID=UPI000B111E72|nr:carboxypeptidase-like regulatory domain-containing protein [Demequina rhizosphaerae]